jgi:hypothetical protein
VEGKLTSPNIGYFYSALAADSYSYFCELKVKEVFGNIFENT